MARETLEGFPKGSLHREGLLYPAANRILRSQAGELHLNCLHTEAAARCCLAVPAGPYMGIVQLLKWDHGWKPCPMVSLNTPVLQCFCSE